MNEYLYTKLVDNAQLADEIKASVILNGIFTGSINTVSDQVKIYMNQLLDTTQKSELDSIVNNHVIKSIKELGIMESAYSAYTTKKSTSKEKVKILTSQIVENIQYGNYDIIFNLDYKGYYFNGELILNGNTIFKIENEKNYTAYKNWVNISRLLPLGNSQGNIDLKFNFWTNKQKKNAEVKNVEIFLRRVD